MFPCLHAYNEKHCVNKFASREVKTFSNKLKNILVAEAVLCCFMRLLVSLHVCSMRNIWSWPLFSVASYAEWAGRNRKTYFSRESVSVKVFF